MLHGEKSIVEITRDLDVRAELLYRWKREYLSEKEHSFPGAGHLHSPEAERIRKLERELRLVIEERDILKKAVSIFSKTPK